MKRRGNHPTGPVMRIGGETVSTIVARIRYRCAECLGELQLRDAGLACKADQGHKGFIHKRDVPAVQALREEQMAAVEAAYEIVDGVLRPKGDLFNADQRLTD